MVSLDPSETTARRPVRAMVSFESSETTTSMLAVVVLRERFVNTNDNKLNWSCSNTNANECNQYDNIDDDDNDDDDDDDNGGVDYDDF